MNAPRLGSLGKCVMWSDKESTHRLYIVITYHVKILQMGAQRLNLYSSVQIVISNRQIPRKNDENKKKDTWLNISIIE